METLAVGGPAHATMIDCPNEQETWTHLATATTYYRRMVAKPYGPDGKQMIGVPVFVHESILANPEAQHALFKDIGVRRLFEQLGVVADVEQSGDPESDGGNSGAAPGDNQDGGATLQQAIRNGGRTASGLYVPMG